MSGSSCPPRDQFEDFLLGRLSSSDERHVARHLDDCPACREAVAECEELADSLVAGLRAPRQQAAALADRCFQDAIQRVRGFLPGDGPSGDAGTGPEDGDRELLPVESTDLVELRDYRLLRKLGEGGMGTVFKALHTRLERIVALKVLPPDRMRSEAALARFQREMRAVGALDHPALVRATDAGDLDGTHFLVMEYVDGLDLSALAERLGPLPLAEACELVRQAAVGLQHVHERGMVHRDVKPSNLMLTPAGQVKILDLGLALLHGEHGSMHELTTVGQFMGTLDYIAPEQADDSHDVDIRADIYSLGATLYRLVCGTAPFGGPEFRSPLRKFKGLALLPVPPVRERRPDVPAGLAAVIERMLSKSPGERFATPAEVEQALAPFAAGSDLAALFEAAQARAGDERSRAAEAVPRRTDVSIPPRDKAVPGTGRPQGPSDVPPRRGWFARIALVLVGLGALVGAGVVIHVQTDQGDLVIQSSDPDVQVQIRRAGEPVDDWELQQGDNRTTLRSGEYEIELLAPTDGLQVRDGRFTLSRGGEHMATIERRGRDPERELAAPLEHQLKAMEIEAGNLRQVVHAFGDPVKAFREAQRELLEAADQRIQVAAQRVTAAQKDLRVEEAALETARLEYETQTRLAERGEVSNFEQQRAERRVREAEARVQRAEAAVAATRNEEQARRDKRKATEERVQRDIDTATAQYEEAHARLARLERERRNLELRISRRLRPMAGEEAEVVKEGDPSGPLDPALTPPSALLAEPVRGEPRYDDRTFSEWVSILRTDRKPERLVEAIFALAALADGEYVRKAVPLIVEAAAQEPSGRVGQAAGYALQKLDSPEAVEMYREMLSTGTSTERTYALRALSRERQSFQLVEGQAEPTVSAPPIRIENARATLSAILEASRDESPQVRRDALSLAVQIDSTDDAVDRRLREAVSDSDVKVAFAAARLLEELNPRAEELVPALFRIAREKIVLPDRPLDSRDRRDRNALATPRRSYDGFYDAHSMEQVRRKAVAAAMLVRIAPDAEGLVPLLMEHLQERESPVMWILQRDALLGLAHLGERAAPAVPLVVEFIEDQQFEPPSPTMYAWSEDESLALGRALVADVPDSEPYTTTQSLPHDFGMYVPPKEAAVLALGSMGPAADSPEVIGALRSLVEARPSDQDSRQDLRSPRRRRGESDRILAAGALTKIRPNSDLPVPWDAPARRIFRELDRNEDGLIDREEFEPPSPRMAHLRNSFRSVVEESDVEFPLSEAEFIELWPRINERARRRTLPRRSGDGRGESSRRVPSATERPDPDGSPLSTYAGKTFDEWAAMLQTERHPEAVSEAILALAALANDERAAEAVALIVREAARYGNPVTDGVGGRVGSGDAQVRAAAVHALQRLGAPEARATDEPGDATKEAIDALAEELHFGSSAERGYALRALWQRAVPLQLDADRTVPGRVIPPEHARRALPGVLDVSRDEDPLMRFHALDAAANLAPRHTAVHQRLTEALDDPELSVSARAAERLAQIDPRAPGLAETLLRLVRDEATLTLGEQAQFAALLAETAPQTDGLVDELIRLLQQEERELPDFEARGTALRAVATLGPRAAPAVPALVPLLDRRQVLPPLREQWQRATGRFSAQGFPRTPLESTLIPVIDALVAIGPAANTPEVVSALETLVSDSTAFEQANRQRGTRRQNPLAPIGEAAADALARLQADPEKLRSANDAVAPIRAPEPFPTETDPPIVPLDPAEREAILKRRAGIDAAPPASLTWEGRGFEEWAAVLRAERQPERVAEALRALASLAEGDQAPWAADLLLDEALKHAEPSAAMRREPAGASTPRETSRPSAARTSGWPAASGTAATPWSAAVQGLLRIDGAVVAGTFTRELPRGAADRRMRVMAVLVHLLEGPSIGLGPSWSRVTRHREQMREALPAVLAASHDEEPLVRALALWAAVALAPDDDSVESRLVAALDDPGIEVRYGAAVALAAVVNPQAPGLPAALTDLVRSADPGLTAWQRANAAERLAHVAPETDGLMAELVNLLRQEDREAPDWNVRGVALAALQPLGPRAAPALPALLDILRDPESQRASAAPTEAALLQYGRVGSPRIATLAIELLPKLGPEANRPEVPALLRELRGEIRFSASRTLQLIESRRAAAPSQAD